MEEPPSCRLPAIEAEVKQMRRLKIIVEEHSDGFVAYPLGVKGVVVGQGDSSEDALADVHPLSHREFRRRVIRCKCRDPECATA